MDEDGGELGVTGLLLRKSTEVVGHQAAEGSANDADLAVVLDGLVRLSDDITDGKLVARVLIPHHITVLLQSIELVLELEEAGVSEAGKQQEDTLARFMPERLAREMHPRRGSCQIGGQNVHHPFRIEVSFESANNNYSIKALEKQVLQILKTGYEISTRS